MKISVKAIAVNMVVLTSLFTLLNAYPNIKLLGYSFKEQMKDILPSTINSLIMAFVVYIIGEILSLSDIYLLFVQVISGFLIYIVLSYLFSNKELKFIYSILLSKIHYANK